MSQQPNSPNTKPQAVRAASQRATSGGQLIEKGWTVVDALGTPIGNVTDVDVQRGKIAVDGRPVGFSTFEVPLTYVGKSSDHEVRLSKVIDTAAASTDDIPRFTDAPQTAPTGVPAGGSTSMRAERATVHTSASPAPAARAEQASTASGPTPLPHAATAPTDPRVTSIHTGDSQHESPGWSTTKMALSGLALGGLAAAGYVLKQRMRRKTAFERFMDASGEYAGLTAQFARERHPAWWGALAAAALPLAAYYAMPGKPTATQQAHDQMDSLSEYLERQLDDLNHWLPVAGAVTAEAVAGGVKRLQHSASQLTMPDSWNRPATWSVSTEAALSAALIAVSGLAIYLARRDGQAARRSIIGDVMTRRPRTVHPNATVADAAALMRQMDVGGLPVCDGSRLVGMVTDRDITIRSAADGRDPHLTPVRDIMSSGVAWAVETDPVEEAARIMREHRIRRLPIVDERHSLVGMVSLGDLAVDANDREMSAEALEEISEPSRPNRAGQ